MEKYDYRRAITNDLKDWIINDTDIQENREQYGENDELVVWIEDETFGLDEITGNSMYYYDTEDKCSEYIAGNFDLVYEGAREMGFDDDNIFIIKHYEEHTLARYLDCCIRCYLLYECIWSAIEELNLKI